MKRCQLAQFLGMQIIRAIEEQQAHDMYGAKYLRIPLNFRGSTVNNISATIDIPVFQTLSTRLSPMGVFSNEYHYKTLAEYFGWKKV